MGHLARLRYSAVTAVVLVARLLTWTGATLLIDAPTLPSGSCRTRLSLWPTRPNGDLTGEIE
jgi:hypothetical protein